VMLVPRKSGASSGLDPVPENRPLAVQSHHQQQGGFIHNGVTRYSPTVTPSSVITVSPVQPPGVPAPVVPPAGPPPAPWARGGSAAEHLYETPQDCSRIHGRAPETSTGASQALIPRILHRVPGIGIFPAHVQSQITHVQAKLLLFLVKHGLPLPYDVLHFLNQTSVSGLFRGDAVEFSGAITRTSIKHMAKIALSMVTYVPLMKSGVQIGDTGLQYGRTSIHPTGPSLIGPPGMSLHPRPKVTFPICGRPCSVVIDWIRTEGEMTDILSEAVRMIVAGKKPLGLTLKGTGTPTVAAKALLSIFQEMASGGDHDQVHCFPPNLSGILTGKRHNGCFYLMDFETGGRPVAPLVREWAENAGALEAYNEEFWAQYEGQCRHWARELTPYQAFNRFERCTTSVGLPKYTCRLPEGREIGAPCVITGPPGERVGSQIVVPTCQTTDSVDAFMGDATVFACQGRCVQWTLPGFGDVPGQFGFYGMTPLGTGCFTIATVAGERRVVALYYDGPISTRYGPIEQIVSRVGAMVAPSQSSSRLTRVFNSIKRRTRAEEPRKPWYRRK